MRTLGRSKQWRGLRQGAAAALVLATVSARAEAPSGRFVVNAQTAYDVVTKLTWQRNVPPLTFTYAGADDYCASLAGGFRLPTLKELHSIVDFRQTAGAVDPLVFPNAPSGYEVWSSTSSENGRFGLSFTSGVTGLSLPPDTMGAAFCVK